ncbi:putative oxidoreductase [Helianthus debilis subsp. tardiflorus]
MDPQNNHSSSLHPQELRQLLVLQPPYIFKIQEHLFADRFQVLKEYDSPLPTHDFLHAHGQFVKVVLCSGTGPITVEVIRDLPAFKLVVTDATGVNHIDMAECGRRGITVTNTGDVYSDDVADAAVGLLIDIMRRITSGERFVRDGCWTTSREYPLGGKRVGIVGLGNIGSRVATRLEAMGCIVSYTSRQKRPSIPFTFYPSSGGPRNFFIGVRNTFKDLDP